MKKIILALACCGVLASCVKDEDKDPIDVSKTTYLMDGRWQLKAYTWLPDIGDSTAFPVDVYTPLSGCVKDNYYTFNTTNAVARHEGGSKCVISDPDSLEYRYALTETDKFLRIWSNADDMENSTVLAGSIEYPSIDTFIVTYTKPKPGDTALTSRYVETYVKQK